MKKVKNGEVLRLLLIFPIPRIVLWLPLHPKEAFFGRCS
jgi:hypothetical protein